MMHGNENEGILCFDGHDCYGNLHLLRLQKLSCRVVLCFRVRPQACMHAVSEIIPAQETAGSVKHTSKEFHETRKPWSLIDKKNVSEDSKPVISEIATVTLTPQRVPVEINLVQYIHMLTDRHLREESGSEFDAQFLAREKEVLFVLGKNLNHSLVKTVHIIAEDKTMVERYLISKRLNNWDKIVVHHNGKPCTYRDVFEYISDYLQNKTVMFANEDIYLGEGFKKVDPVMMRDSKIMYISTRHNSPAFGHCQDKLKQSNCSQTYRLNFIYRIIICCCIEVRKIAK